MFSRGWRTGTYDGDGALVLRRIGTDVYNDSGTMTMKMASIGAKQLGVEVGDSLAPTTAAVEEVVVYRLNVRCDDRAPYEVKSIS